jgi:hypothetical protein
VASGHQPDTSGTCHQIADRRSQIADRTQHPTPKCQVRTWQGNGQQYGPLYAIGTYLPASPAGGPAPPGFWVPNLGHEPPRGRPWALWTVPAAPPSHAPPDMDLADWFGPQGVLSSGEAAHIFGSGSMPPPSPSRLPTRLHWALTHPRKCQRQVRALLNVPCEKLPWPHWTHAPKRTASCPKVGYPLPTIKLLRIVGTDLTLLLAFTIASCSLLPLIHLLLAFTIASRLHYCHSFTHLLVERPNSEASSLLLAIASPLGCYWYRLRFSRWKWCLHCPCYRRVAVAYTVDND